MIYYRVVACNVKIARHQRGNKGVLSDCEYKTSPALSESHRDGLM